MDFTTLTDDELDLLRRDVLMEKERRQRIERTPEQVAQLAAAFEKDGGDRAALVTAITERNDQ
ncbi:hypothetical protein [Microbacterium sp.]|uniref:hypothetical protein n=1 Tax=Microbacterium sp. TaxID=51671 RepID=UPI003F9916A2